MVHYGMITQADADAAGNEQLKIRPKSRRVIQDTYAMDAVRRELDRILEEHNIEEGGLTVITTCLLYTSPSPRDATLSRMPSSA